MAKTEIELKPTKTFESFSDILKDEKFPAFLKKELSDQENRPSPPEGRKYINQGAYDVLLSKKLFEIENFLEEFERIVDKNSSLSSSVRAYIVQIVNRAGQKTALYYLKPPQKRATIHKKPSIIPKEYE